MGKVLESLAGRIADMAEVRKKMEEELEEINNSLQQKEDSAITVSISDLIENDAKLPTGNTAIKLINVVKELYKLANKAIPHIKPDEAAVRSSPTMDLVKEELARLLPGLIKEGLAGTHQPQSSTTTGKAISTAPAVKYTLDLEKMSTGSEDGTADAKITEADWTKVVKKDVQKSLKSVPVIKSSTSSGGTARLQFRSKEDLASAEQALQAKYKLTSKSEETKKLDPKITIFDLEDDILDKNKLEEEVLNKNEGIKKLKDQGELFKTIFIDDKDRIAVLQVSPAIREVIRKNNDKVCLGLEIHRIKDRFHVVQCYHCQGYGHTSGSVYCRSREEDPSCFFCAGSHASKDCRKKKDKKLGEIKCTNCVKSRSRDERGSSGTHKASDTLCPFYIREKVRVMSRTHASEETKNMYQVRVRELLKKHGRT